MRRAAALATVAAGFALLPLHAASACSPAYDPSCKPQPCWTVDHYWYLVQPVTSDPIC